MAPSEGEAARDLADAPTAGDSDRDQEEVAVRLHALLPDRVRDPPSS